MKGLLVTRTSIWTLLFVAITASPLLAGVNPADDDYSGRKGTTIYVSKLGDNSDGSSWEKAFHSIQKAIQSVPDDKGGHRVIIRPDHYVDPNLAPNRKGAAGSYNLLIGDIDGKYGSGAKGWVVIDAGDPEKGFKAWDWWSNIAASSKNWSRGNNKQNFSSIVWDRWALKNVYASGGDAGLFWDLTHESGKGFTVLVEDCVGIGRAFGGGVVLSGSSAQRAQRLPPLLLPGPRLGRRYGGRPARRMGKNHAGPPACRFRRLRHRPSR